MMHGYFRSTARPRVGRIPTRAVLAGLCIGMWIPRPSAVLHAQVGFPDVPVVAAGRSAAPVMAAEGAHHVKRLEVRQEILIGLNPTHVQDYARDSILTTVTAPAERWRTQLDARGVEGMQLDPMAFVAVYANHVDEARALIAKRLATPALSFEEKAYTYMTAVQSFTAPQAPALMPAAEAYLAQLDAMGDSAAYWQFRARASMVQTYYRLGRSAEVAKHGARAIALVGIMRFQDRVLMFPWSPTDPLYLMTMEAVSGTPGGRAEVARLNAVLKAAVTVPPALLARDSATVGMGEHYQEKLAEYLRTGALLGQPARPIVGSYWLNRASSDSASMPLNDGKIRLLEVSDHGCGPCILAMHGMQRLQRQFPQIEPMFVTLTFGSWGNRLIEPDAEVELIADFIRTKTKVTYPVAILKRPRVPNDEGGVAPEGDGVNYENYPPLEKPTLWLVDGKGIVRNVFVGYSRDKEAQMARSIAFLLHEAGA